MYDKTKGKINYKKEYKKYLTASVLDTANNKIASSSFISAFAVYLGLSDLAIGIYVVLDTITNIVQIFAATFFGKFGQSKKVVLTNYTIYRISSICFAFIPFISENITIRTIFFFIFASIYAVTGELGYVTFVNWRMTLLEKEDRIKFAAIRNVFRNTVVVVFSLIMGIILDKCTASGYELYGFLTLFSVIFLIALIDIMIKVNTYKPEIEKKSAKVLDSIKMPAKDKPFRKVLVVCGLNRFAHGIGTMYLNVFILRYLQINYLYYGILNIVINLSSAMLSNFWKNQAESREWKKVILPMCLVSIIAFGILLYFENSILIYLLPIVYILMGIYDSAYDIYDHTAIYESAKEDYQTSYVTFERFIEGIITAILPILSYTIFKESSNAIKITFGLAIATYIILFLYFKNVHKKNKNETIKQQI